MKRKNVKTIKFNKIRLNSKKSIKIKRKDTKRNTTKRKTIYNLTEYNSGDGMLTSVWGPSMWHYLHTMSFNYPVKPSKNDKQHYKSFIVSLKNVLPCKHCRENLKKNFKLLPLREKHLKNRASFSKYVFNLHETVNKLLGKQSGLTYCEVRDRYEHFRSRCTIDKPEMLKKKHIKTVKHEKGCTEPLYGKKSKCVIKIIPQDKREKTFQMDNQCIKKR
jgi:hypothetical protein